MVFLTGCDSLPVLNLECISNVIEEYLRIAISKIIPDENCIDNHLFVILSQGKMGKRLPTRCGISTQLYAYVTHLHLLYCNYKLVQLTLRYEICPILKGKLMICK